MRELAVVWQQMRMGARGESESGSMSQMQRSTSGEDDDDADDETGAEDVLRCSYSRSIPSLLETSRKRDTLRHIQYTKGERRKKKKRLLRTSSSQLNRSTDWTAADRHL